MLPFDFNAGTLFLLQYQIGIFGTQKKMLLIFLLFNFPALFSRFVLLKMRMRNRFSNRNRKIRKLLKLLDLYVQFHFEVHTKIMIEIYPAVVAKWLKWKLSNLQGQPSCSGPGYFGERMETNSAGEKGKKREERQNFVHFVVCLFAHLLCVHIVFEEYFDTPFFLLPTYRHC